MTLTGVGGVGKTRLALQVAAELLPRFREGAWLIELAAVRDPDEVIDAFAAVFGVTARAGQSVGGGAERSSSRRSSCCWWSTTASTCWTRSPTWSRSSVVRARGSWCWRRAGRVSRSTVNAWSRCRRLAAPDADADLAAVGASDAVQLFVERARAADADFVLDAANASAVGQVCRRLDGVPLAIELAAARVTSMSPAELASALDRRFDVLAGGRRRAVKRQQTLRATIDWSYDLLDESQRRLLARLAVFAGGCTREAAEAICAGGPIDGRAVLGLLDRPGGPVVGRRRTRWSRDPLPAVGDHPRVRRGTPRRARRDRRAARPARPLLRRVRLALLRGAVGAGADRVRAPGWPPTARTSSRRSPTRWTPMISTSRSACWNRPACSLPDRLVLTLPVEPVLAEPGVEQHPSYPLVLMAAAYAAQTARGGALALEYSDAALGVEQALPARSPYTVDLERAPPVLSAVLAVSTGAWDDAAAAFLDGAESTAVRTAWASSPTASPGLRRRCATPGDSTTRFPSRPRRSPSPRARHAEAHQRVPRRARPGALPPRSRTRRAHCSAKLPTRTSTTRPTASSSG